MASSTKVATAADVRNSNTYLHEVRPGEPPWRLRALDMTTIVLNNLIPFHLLKAAKKFEDIQRGIDTAASQDAKEAHRAIDDLDPQVLQQYVEFLKHYACTVVVEPKMSPAQTNDPDILYVGELSGDDLMNIFKARKPAAPDETQEVPRIQTPEIAEDFRRSEKVPAPAPALPSESLRSAAELVDFPDREAIHQ